MGKLRQALRWLSKLSKRYPHKGPSKSAVLRSQIDKLPVELIEHIFILAAYDPDLTPLTLNLACVARWVNGIILPVLYQNVHLQTDKQAQRFLNTITAKPDVCQFITSFVAPQVNIFKRAWPKRHAADLCLPYVAALDRQAPHLRTLAKIFPILFPEEPAEAGPTTIGDVAEAGEDAQENGTATISRKAPILRSVAIHALTLCPPFDVTAEALSTRVMQLPSDVTLSGFGTSSIVRWNFSRVERLRFTSVVNGGTLRTEELLLVPNLTHLALPLWRNTFETTKQLLTSPKLQRLVLFVLFDPIDDETMAKVTSGATETDLPNDQGQPPATPPTAVAVPNPQPQPTGTVGTATATTTVAANPGQTAPTDPNASSSSLQAVFSESAALRGIDDQRLILFNIREMVTLCRVSSQKFWDEVELRASHIAAHVVLGKLRSLAGNSLTES